MKLGRLQKVDLRKVWQHEAYDFTQWLAQESNLGLLSEELGIDIRVVRTEAEVGRYNVDILAEEEDTGRKIIIENQLEVTDHDHLGKIVTYASGYDAEIIIWIVKDVRDEHKQAVDWLNEHTDEKINFFVTKMELWQIDESAFAPKFHIVSQPNNWAKAIKGGKFGEGTSERNMMQLDFWTKFRSYMSEKGTKLSLRKPFPQHWYDFSTGVSNVHITLTIGVQIQSMACELYIGESKAIFHALYHHKEEIEKQIGEPLEWMELPEKKASRIKLAHKADIKDATRWGEHFAWLKVTAEKFHFVFSQYKAIMQAASANSK